ncbi:MAG: DUF1343 domain-containing protein [Rhodopirellula baltica]
MFSLKLIMHHPCAVACLLAISLSVSQSSVASAQVLAGIDVLQRDDFASLAGQNVGLITNHTGTNLAGASTVQLLHDSKEVDLVALFSPEHGFVGQLDQANIDDQQDALTGLRVHSLYGKTRVPTAEMLEGIDTLVFDIQDIGVRFYTYISTMGGAMKAAAENDVRFVVLDRPNPINGTEVQGPITDEGSESFIAYHRIPVRHGMTIGELAKMFQAEWELDLDLQVIPMEGWEGRPGFDQTGRMWINPSPNMRSLNAAYLYPAIGLWETTNLSVGRGTDTPFEHFGAPWIDALELASELNAQGLSGVRFVPIEFTPNASKFANEKCGGVNVILTQRAEFDPLQTSLTIAVTLRKLAPDDWNTKSLNRLLVSQKTAEGILGGHSVEQLQAAYQEELEEFQNRRLKYLMYR